MRGRAFVKLGQAAGMMAGVTVWLTLSAPAQGQNNQVEKFERQLEQIQRDQRLRVDLNVPVDQRVLIDYGGYVSLNFFAIDDLDQETHILRQYDLTAYARVNIDGAHDFFVRVRTSYRDFNEGDAFDSHGDDWVEPTLDRATYRFDLARHMAAYEGQPIDWNLVVQGGRQLVHWANGLVLSDDIDGALISYTRDDWRFDFLAGATRDSNTDFDSSRPDFSGDTHRGFYGGLLSYQVTDRHRPYVYGLVQQDYNDEDFATIGGAPTSFEYNSWYIGVGSNGSFSDQWLYGAEIVYEGGDTLSSSIDGTGAAITQTEDDISAWAFDVTTDYLLNDANRTRLSAEFVVASGDDDRQFSSTNTFLGNTAGTTDKGFNAFGLVNAGLAFSPSISNIMLFRVGASTYPLPTHKLLRRFQVGTNVLFFGKTDGAAPIDELSTGNSFLGAEIDLFATWQITSDLSIAMRYGCFFPGDGIVSNEDPRNFLFTGLTWAF